jgi:diguanylate cyclase (GGDEF)-like protein
MVVAAEAGKSCPDEGSLATVLGRWGGILVHVRTKLRILILFVVLVPQFIILGMAWNSVIQNNPVFNRIAAVSLAGALLTAMIVPQLVVNWLVGNSLSRMRALCSRVKQGNYQELLSLPNEARDGEDEDGLITLMRDMNWMAKQIGIREKELQQAIGALWESRRQISEQNQFLKQVNTELVTTQEHLHERTAELENACRQMQIMAMTDPLTSIANRRCFFETLEGHITQPVCQCQPISLLMIDIDRFKSINDHYGHQAGDQVLLELAAMIQHNIRSGDLAARIGGEEYALLLPNTDVEGALNAACRISLAVADHAFRPDGETRVAVTVSIGVCTLIRYPCLCIERFYQYADQALYHSKRSGRNAVSIYEPDTGTVRVIGCH